MAEGKKGSGLVAANIRIQGNAQAVFSLYHWRIWYVGAGRGWEGALDTLPSWFNFCHVFMQFSVKVSKNKSFLPQNSGFALPCLGNHRSTTVENILKERLAHSITLFIHP